MSHDWDCFTSLEEHNSNFNIELGDNANYNLTGTGIVRFQRESRKPFLVKEVLYVPR